MRHVLQNKRFYIALSIVLSVVLVFEIIHIRRSLVTMEDEIPVSETATVWASEQIGINPELDSEKNNTQDEDATQEEGEHSEDDMSENDPDVEDDTENDQKEQDQPEEPEETDREPKDSEGESDQKDGDQGGTNPDQPSESDDGQGQPGSLEDKDKDESDSKPGDDIDDKDLSIVTDLRNQEITYAELTNDTFGFYAYIVNGESDMTLRVKLRNSDTPANGKYLTGNGRDYETSLKRGEANFFTLYIRQGGKTIYEATYTIRYVAQKADADHPEVGDHPPVISTNLDDHEHVTSNQNFTFLVSANTYQGSVIYSSAIEVRMDGTLIKNPTGGPVYEYQLYFSDPVIGDATTHTITVLAWDAEGNSTFKSYDMTYQFVDTGDEIGTAYIVIDATTVGLGILEEPFEYRIKQGEPASYAVLAMLDELGYEYEYGGNPDSGFYLRRIIRGGLMDWAEVPERLWNLILRDGIGLTGQLDYDSLGEFDYTRGSGWMYSINGTLYAGKGLSNYYLGNGDTLYLRFTLAFGKDIGGASATGGMSGTLSTYCGIWKNGEDIELHQWGSVTVITEPDCTTDGLQASECSICGEHQDDQTIPALGHEYQETGRMEPQPGVDGSVTYTCSRCGDIYQEILPASEPDQPVIPTDPTEPTEPTEPAEPAEPQEPEEQQGGEQNPEPGNEPDPDQEPEAEAEGQN